MCADVASRAPLLSAYLEHLKARQALPTEVADLCSQKPRECLELILQALQEPIGSQLVAAIGKELLENLLNEHSAVLADEVSEHLRTNERFRQAFACGVYASVDPAIIADWVKLFQDLGTTKTAERKSLWSR